jgi:hypothetical protein
MGCSEKELNNWLGKTLEVCAWLVHNYVIDKKVFDKDMSGWSTESHQTDDIQQILTEIIRVLPNSILGWGYLPTVEKLDNMPPGSSVIQDVIFEKIHNMGLQEPPEILREVGWKCIRQI